MLRKGNSMLSDTSTEKRFKFTRRNIFLLTLLFVTASLSAVALLLPLSTEANTVILNIGDVAPQDIIAPNAHSYQSEILTEEARTVAANSVAEVYAAPDANIARTQVNDLRDVLTFIETVRLDEFADIEQKTIDLAAMEHIQLNPESINLFLDMTESSWQALRVEAIIVLEQVMRSTIREDRVEEARHSVTTLVSFSLSEAHANLVTELVTPFIAPNSLYTETLTEERRQEARDLVEPVVQSFLTNETIVSRGQVVSAVDLEALEEFGLLQSQIDWKDYVSVFSLVLVCFGFIVLYIQFRNDLLEDTRGLTVIAILFLIFLFAARFLLPNRTVIPYMFPLAGFGLLVTSLFSGSAGRILALPLAVLSTFGLPYSLELTLFYTFSSVFGVLILRNSQRITNFFWAGAGISWSGVMVMLSFRLVDQNTDLLGVATLIGASQVYGLASISLAVILQFFLSQALGVTTALQLADLARPDQKLLQMILRNSPGTYQHSLQIANLSEQAAELIGANALLTRVGALYHDVGKASQPHFFIENQAPGMPNPHEGLSPQESSAIIIQHVTEGVEIAKHNRIPRQVIDFILEHHGTTITRYQYVRAVEEAGGDVDKVDINDYRYPGPRPQSVETALVMLADGCEARARAQRPQSEDLIRELVEDTIQKRQEAGQLNDTSLTLQQIGIVTESFINTLRGVYHPRIEYPELKKIEEKDNEADTIPVRTESS